MNQTRIGISSFSYSYAIGCPGFSPQKPMSAFELLEKAAALQVPVLQIADNLPLDRLSKTDLCALDAQARSLGITLEVGTRGIKREHLQKYVEIAKLLHSSLLRVVIDTKEDEPPVPEIMRRIKSVLPLLEGEGIVLGIENHDRFKSDVFAQIVEESGSSYVGIVLDTVNSFACEENSEQVLNALGKYTVNLHVKDYRIGRIPNAMGLQVTGTPAGEGFLKLPYMLDVLYQNAKQDFSSILELWMPQEDTEAKTLFKENQWVEKSIQYMKHVLLQPEIK